MSKQTANRSGGKKKSNYLTWVIFALTAVVIALTIHLATRKPKAPPLPPEPPKLSEAEQVLGMVTRLLASAESLSPQQKVARGLAYDQARQLMEAYVRTHPEDAEVRPRLATVLLQMGYVAEAQARVEELLRLRPESADALWLKGQVLRALGDPKYVEYYRRAAEGPDADVTIWSRYGLELLARRQYDQADRYLEKAVRAGARDTATLCALGRRAFDQDHYDAALQHFQQATRNERPGPIPWKMLGEAQREMGKLDDAAISLREALRLLPAAAADPAYQGPSRGDLLMMLGQVRMLQRLWLEAAKAYEEAQEFTLLQGEALLQAAKCYYNAGRYSLAIGYIDLAGRELPGSVEVRDWRRKIEDAHFVPTTSPSPSPQTMP